MNCSCSLCGQQSIAISHLVQGRIIFGTPQGGSQVSQAINLTIPRLTQNNTKGGWELLLLSLMEGTTIHNGSSIWILLSLDKIISKKSGSTTSHGTGGTLGLISSINGGSGFWCFGRIDHFQQIHALDKTSPKVNHKPHTAVPFNLHSCYLSTLDAVKVPVDESSIHR
jgi:hypothetical protein